MKGREYWSNVNSKREFLSRYSKKEIAVYIIYIVIISLILYKAPDSLFLLVIVALGALWLIHGELTLMKGLISSPICRLTDEFIVLDYDRKIISWEKVNRVIWRPTKRKTIVFYKVRPKTKYTALSIMHERLVSIDRKWMKDEDAFFEDFRAMCDERSIPFFVADSDFFFNTQNP